MTTYDPIYLSETEHSLLDHSDVPGVPQGGASVADSWLVSYLSVPVVITDVAADDLFVWGAPDGAGDDLDIDVNGDLAILTAGRYQITYLLEITTDAEANGLLHLKVQPGGTARPAINFLDWTNAVQSIPLRASSHTFEYMALAIDLFDAGNTAPLRIQGPLEELGTGASVTFGNCAVQALRIA